MSERRTDVRNIAIIAHVDHGKTTLVDAMLRQSGVFRANETLVDRVMDSNALERERGITILAKNTSVVWEGVRINIVDTPGHADFGGEVERTLAMVDGVLLLVDASEGRCRRRASCSQGARGRPAPVVVHQQDRPRRRAPAEVLDEIYGLFIDLGANEEQLDFPIIFTIAKAGTASRELGDARHDLRPLFDVILSKLPGRSTCRTRPCSSRRTTSPTTTTSAASRSAASTPARCWRRAVHALPHRGLAAAVQDHAALRLARLEARRDRARRFGRHRRDRRHRRDQHRRHGRRQGSADGAEAHPRRRAHDRDAVRREHEPVGRRSGNKVTSRQVRDRLFQETLRNVSIRVEETEATDTFRVVGRGELQLAVLIETMRREGFELQVSKPTVIVRGRDGVVEEPVELSSSIRPRTTSAS
jgi:GTP-binding protein